MPEKQRPAIEVRTANDDDFAWCVHMDAHTPPQAIRRKIRDGEILIAEENGERAGFLRFEYLWSHMPFIAQILVEENRRGRGIGRRMLKAFETRARDAKAPFILSSSMPTEPRAQAWHRKMGFKECGFLAGINDGGIGEVFFIKRRPT